MSLHTIFSLAITFATIGILLVIPGFLISYFLIYKKLLKGRKRLSPAKVLWWCAFLCYTFIVLSATIFMRIPSWWTGEFYPLFYSYKEAWITGSAASWRNIFMNYVMFMPIGFLLPLGIKRLSKCGRTVLFAFGFSFAIELVQFLTKRGMFELDDLLGNTLGALIGYGIFHMFRQALATRSRKQLKKQFRVVS